MTNHWFFLLYFGVLSFLNFFLLGRFHVSKQLGIIVYPVVIILVFLEMVLIAKILEVFVKRSWTKKRPKRDGRGPGA